MEDFFAKKSDIENDEDSEEKFNNINNNIVDVKTKMKPKNKIKSLVMPPMDFVKAKQYLGIKTSATMEVLLEYFCVLHHHKKSF